MPSTDPGRRSDLRRVWVTRYMRNGLGDEFSARDAMSASRNAMTAMKDMHRAITFASGSPGSIARQEFDTMAKPPNASEDRRIDTIGPEMVRHYKASL
ncbi:MULTISPECIES: hypothetical protein [unclassified Nonomuraea]|uniref:hypothetical protein n=1 Tax=unclassified Nonomuraea TaxID=2593643 RepID=UPI0033DBE0D5